jgi:ABC-type polar amino acid transport system ATPase subunit
VSGALEIRRLSLRRGARQILRDVDIDVGTGEILALMGLSGSGKTTLLRVVAGLEPHDGGTVACGKVGMVFQFHFLFEHMTALENVWLALVHAQRVPRPEAERRAQALLDQLGVGHRARALPRELSGGEAQRVAIARALAVDPPLLLLDEPTASLDPARKDDLGTRLRELASAGRALVLTSHDADFVRDHATHVAILADGDVVERGVPSHILVDPQHAATRALLRMGGDEHGR